MPKKFIQLFRYITPMIISICIFFSANTGYAQVEFLVNGYEEKYFNHDEGPGAEETLTRDGKIITSRYIYETPSVKALSHMYWLLGTFNISNNYAVDEFLRVNECDIYKKFSPDEFEWEKIRNAGKNFIEKNKRDFPTRFEFLLPLKLLDYDEKRQAFEIQEKFKIKSMRRFELQATDIHTLKPCIKDHPSSRGYPRVMFMEFSRPFNLTHIPITKEKAIKYIKNKNKLVKLRYKGRDITKSIIYNARDAILILKIKVFAHGKFLGVSRQGHRIIQLMGILEGYDIYEDNSKSNLFYSQTYISNKKKGRLNNKLKEQYEILRKKSKETGILH